MDRIHLGKLRESLKSDYIIATNTCNSISDIQRIWKTILHYIYLIKLYHGIILVNSKEDRIHRFTDFESAKEEKYSGSSVKHKNPNSLLVSG